MLIDMASNLGLPFRVFSLDTGRLHPETYQFLETVRKYYNIEIEICFPETEAVQQLVQEKGYLAFLKMGIRNVAEFVKFSLYEKKLATLDGRITGQRKDQSPGYTQRYS